MKKKNLNARKLNVDLETVRALSEKELVNVPGGQEAVNNSFTSRCYACPSVYICR